MCRLLGIVASEPTEFGLALTQAPRCLATLSREHPDGWGNAIHHAIHHDSSPSSAPANHPSLARPVCSELQQPQQLSWELYKGTAPACEDRRFHEIATGSRGEVLIAHIRQKTVG